MDCDFVKSSVEIVKEISKAENIKLESQLFDMLNPTTAIKLSQILAFSIFGALEQLASEYNNIVDYFINNKPVVCLHTEPAVEL